MAHDLIMAHDLNYLLASLGPGEGPGEVTVEEGGKRNDGEKAQTREKKEKEEKRGKKKRKEKEGNEKGRKLVSNIWSCDI